MKMKLLNILLLVCTLFFSSCALKQELKQNENNENVIDKTPIAKGEIIEEKSELIVISEKKKEFLEIVKNDKYASLCSQKKKVEDILKIKNNDSFNKEIEQLFYEYVNNLANSCIDLNLLQNDLKKKEAVENNMHYEYYKEELNKEALIKEFNDEKIKLEDIFKKYEPKHPDFFPLINYLKHNNLDLQQRYKLRLNIERLKLLKYENSNNFIQLNIPSVNFSFYENGKNIKSFGTVVGEYNSQTPILSSTLTHFVINPTWNIPDSIAKNTIIPRALKDKNYLRKKNIVVRKNYNLDSQRIDFNRVDWKRYLNQTSGYIPYKFIQLPSKTNGMGRIKFMFPNAHAVYMHDTIGTWRFGSSKEKIRFTSHGCVRLEHPLAFMKYITTNYTKFPYSYTRNIYDKFKTQNINLSKKLSVHITYITTSIKNGKIFFYKDIYGYDKLQKLNFAMEI